MLDPKKNRIDFGSQLAPPSEYELTFAIGTTYSLDLEALILIPVSLFYSQPIEGNPDQIRYDMLDAITNASKKITVFCQKSQIKVPKRYHPLMAYWEPGIAQVQMNKENESFHPKVWIVRYDSPKQAAVYRILVTSRNLTFDESWDMAFSSAGRVGSKECPENDPLIHFLEELQRKTKRKLDKKFLTDLRKVKFELPEGIENIEFHPIGIEDKTKSKVKIKSPLASEKWEQLLIMSPFLDQKTLKNFRRLTKRPIALFSRKEALDELDRPILENGFEVWKFSPLIEKASELDDLDNSTDYKGEQGLHAKFFIGVKEGKSNWFIGSANCTDPAQERNIEFLVQLVSKGKDRYRPNAIKKQLTSTSENDSGIQLFEPYDLNEEREYSDAKSLDFEIRKIKFQISKAKLKGNASLTEQGTSYRLDIEMDAKKILLPNGMTMTVKPLAEQAKKPVEIIPGIENIIKDFGPYSEAELSPYLVFNINKDGIQISSFLLEMDIELPESRLGRIFSLIIDNRDKFLKYLTFLLTGEENSIVADQNSLIKSSASQSNTSFFDGTPLFEKMMMAASRNPEKLKSVDELVKRLKSESPESEKIIEAEFENFWEVFREFIPKK